MDKFDEHMREIIEKMLTVITEHGNNQGIESGEDLEEWLNMITNSLCFVTARHFAVLRANLPGLKMDVLHHDFCETVAKMYYSLTSEVLGLGESVAEAPKKRKDAKNNLH